MSVIKNMMRGGAADAPEPTEPTTIANSQIRASKETQTREATNPATVEEYRAAWLDNAQFPPIVVFSDGENYWLSKGAHRLESHIKAFGPGAEIAADIRPGTQRDALFNAFGDNAEHGLRRTNQDKIREVHLMLKDAEWSQWSDNAIAKRCKVSQPFVSEQRKQLEAAGDIAKSMIRKTASGLKMDTSKIGNAPKSSNGNGKGGGGGGKSTYNDYKPAPTAPVYIEPKPGFVPAIMKQVTNYGAPAPDAPAADSIPFETEPATYNGYKPEETRALPPGKLLIELPADVVGELLTVVRQNGLGFLMHKSSVAALESALSEVIE